MYDIRNYKAKKPILYLERGGVVEEIDLPTRKAVCPACHGEGTTVNPAVDGHGISPEEFHEDPDFAEAYFGGVYDVPCNYCDGLRVVDEVAVEYLDETTLKAWQTQCRTESELEAEIAAERRMGA